MTDTQKYNTNYERKTENVAIHLEPRHYVYNITKYNFMESCS